MSDNNRSTPAYIEDRLVLALCELNGWEYGGGEDYDIAVSNVKWFIENYTKLIKQVTAKTEQRGWIDMFHAHLDICSQCENHPFDLCPIGAMLLREAVIMNECAVEFRRKEALEGNEQEMKK